MLKDQLFSNITQINVHYLVLLKMLAICMHPKHVPHFINNNENVNSIMKNLILWYIQFGFNSNDIITMKRVKTQLQF